MKMKNFVSGLIIGSVTTLTVGVFAQGLFVEAQIMDNINITVDGKQVSTKGYEILNYEGFNYTPARLIAESMGGTVDFDESTSTIEITTPEPIIVETIVEVPVPVEVPTYAKYTHAPMKDEKDDVKITIFSAESFSSTYINMDIKNANSEGYVLFYTNDIYLEDEKGNKNYVYDSSDNPLRGSLTAGTEIKDLTLQFDPVETGTELKLVMPYELTAYGKTTTDMFEFFIIIE